MSTEHIHSSHVMGVVNQQGCYNRTSSCWRWSICVITRNIYGTLKTGKKHYNLKKKKSLSIHKLHTKVKVKICPTHPCLALKNIKNLLLCNWLVGSLWVGLRSRSKNGRNVNINERKELSVKGCGGLTQLPKDPILERRKKRKRDAPLRKIIFHQTFKPVL